MEASSSSVSSVTAGSVRRHISASSLEGVSSSVLALLETTAGVATLIAKSFGSLKICPVRSPTLRDG